MPLDKAQAELLLEEATGMAQRCLTTGQPKFDTVEAVLEKLRDEVPPGMTVRVNELLLVFAGAAASGSAAARADAILSLQGAARSLKKAKALADEGKDELVVKILADRADGLVSTTEGMLEVLDSLGALANEPNVANAKAALASAKTALEQARGLISG